MDILSKALEMGFPRVDVKKNIKPPTTSVNDSLIVSEIQNFINYVDNFYNEDYGIYPMTSRENIQHAVHQFITQPREVSLFFDSLDREAVKNILHDRGFKEKEK